MTGAYKTFTENIQTQVDGKSEIYYQASDPAVYAGDDKWGAKHVGDILRCTAEVKSNTSTGNTTKVTRAKNSEWVWKEISSGVYGWHEMEIPDNIFDAYDGKATMYVSKPASYKVKDMWILDKEGKDGTDSNYDSTYPTYKKGTLLVATATSTSYDKSHWAEKTRYTDDTYAKEVEASLTTLKNAYEKKIDDYDNKFSLVDDSIAAAQEDLDSLNEAIEALNDTTSATDGTVNDLDAAVAGYLGVGGTVLQGANTTISPYIGGGYLNITSDTTRVIIDPHNKTKNGYVF
jgi:hypothetical protein